MLSVILLPMMIMMMQISTFSVIRHLICGSKLELASELEFDLRDSEARIGLFISMLEKLDWFRLTDLTTLSGAINVKIDASVLEEIMSFKMLGLTSPSKLNWGLLHNLFC